MIRFALDRGIHVIPKSITPSRIESNSQVFDFKLTSDEIQQIKEGVQIKKSKTFNAGIENFDKSLISSHLDSTFDSAYRKGHNELCELKTILPIMSEKAEFCEIDPYVRIFLNS